MINSRNLIYTNILDLTSKLTLGNSIRIFLILYRLQKQLLLFKRA